MKDLLITAIVVDLAVAGVVWLTLWALHTGSTP